MQFLDIKWLGFEEGKNADEKSNKLKSRKLQISDNSDLKLKKDYADLDNLV